MEAQLARVDKSLSGWLAVHRAESAAMRRERGEMTTHLHGARDGAGTLGMRTDDRFYNTWSLASFDAYQGTCYLHLEDYAQAARHFEGTTMADFAKVRRVLPIIDMVHTYTTLGSVNEASG